MGDALRQFGSARIGALAKPKTNLKAAEAVSRAATVLYMSLQAGGGTKSMDDLFGEEAKHHWHAVKG